ncbi:Anion transporter [Moritella viscosa]|uniref:hypothetical protein n=1 Tax=Moritella viscosa TaxID=80854 RepID=UPI000508FF94|nr:hypothetical protein [Moritella viscosa]CED58354.1 membrane protein [Moritella viscosa]SHN95949.1 Anion transporter [Moritella viscosa]SHO19276.1 Anion transporter [Moritella viscosa]
MYGPLNALLLEVGIPSAMTGSFFIFAILYRKFKNNQMDKYNTKKEQIDFIVDFLSNKKIIKNNFLMEQAFEYKFNYPFSKKQIDVFLLLPNPSQAIRYFLRARLYFNFDNGHDKPYLKEKYKKINSLKKWKVVYFIGYFLCVLLISSMMNFSDAISNLGHLGFIILTVSWALFMAYMCLEEHAKLCSAESLVKIFTDFEDEKMSHLTTISPESVAAVL